MTWIRVAFTVLAGGFVTSLTDWLFMGDWLYKRYNQFPEIWRFPHGQGEMQAIVWSAPLPFVTCAVFTLLCATCDRDLAYRAFTLTHRAWDVHQTALRDYCGLCPRVAGEISRGSRGCEPDSALRSREGFSTKTLNSVVLRHPPVRRRLDCKTEIPGPMTL